MTLRIDIAVEAEGWARVPGAEDWVRRSVEAAAAGAGLDALAGAEVSVLLCDDAAIRVLNRQWRGKDKPTNVLSFPAAAGTMPDGTRPLGDIAVALETTEREARDEGRPVEDHLAHLVVHGVLHLLDHDHEDADEAEAMEALEAAAMARLGLPDPYAGSEPDEPNGRRA